MKITPMVPTWYLHGTQEDHHNLSSQCLFQTQEGRGGPTYPLTVPPKRPQDVWDERLDVWDVLEDAPEKNAN